MIIDQGLGSRDLNIVCEETSCDNSTLTEHYRLHPPVPCMSLRNATPITLLTLFQQEVVKVHIPVRNTQSWGPQQCASAAKS